MDTQAENTLSSLRSRHIKTLFAENATAASRQILGLIPENAVVGIGDSTAVRQLGVLTALEERRTKVLSPFAPGPAEPSKTDEQRKEIQREATLCDVFLTGTNAVTQDGKLVNVDAVGNRVAGMFWGHPLSIVVVGRNKIVRDLDEALQRIRKVIAPTHFHLRTKLGGKKRAIPCARTGECSDCRGPDRGCNVFTIIEGKPWQSDLHVILVNQDLGLGWDPSWPEERIIEIRENYRKHVWVPR
jgi:hypothetical protein